MFGRTNVNLLNDRPNAAFDFVGGAPTCRTAPLSRRQQRPTAPALPRSPTAPAARRDRSWHQLFGASRLPFANTPQPGDALPSCAPQSPPEKAQKGRSLPINGNVPGENAPTPFKPSADQPQEDHPALLGGLPHPWGGKSARVDEMRDVRRCRFDSCTLKLSRVSTLRPFLPCRS